MKNSFLTLCLAVSLLLCSSCKYEDIMTPEELQKMELLNQEIENAKANASDLEKQIIEAGKTALTATQEDQREQAIQTVKILQEEWKRTSSELLIKIQQAEQLRTEATDRVAAPFRELVSKTIPGGDLLWTAVLGVGVPLLFKRSRQHMGTAVATIAKGNLSEAGMSFLRTYGLLHSSEKPEDVLLGAAAAAKKENRLELAIELEQMAAKVRAQSVDKAA